MKKFIVVFWDGNVDKKIKEVEVEWETKKCIWIDGYRYPKKSDFYNYYDTWDEAKAVLIKRQERFIVEICAQLKNATDVLSAVKQLTADDVIREDES